MRHRLIVLLLGVVFVSGSSGAGTIVQVTRRLKMTNAEALPAKDFFIDMGVRDGLKEGEILTVYRFLPVVNAMVGSTHNLLKVPLGELKVTTVGETSAIARLHALREVSELPALDPQSFMLGDQVQRKTSLPFQ